VAEETVPAGRARPRIEAVSDLVLIAGGRPMLLTDAGVTIVCDFSRMVGLVENAVDVARGARTEEEALAHERRVRDEIRRFIETLPEARQSA
jgi:hypothetical protein